MTRTPFPIGRFGEIDVSVEYLNGKPRVRLGNRKGGWFVVPVEEIADVSAALSKAVDLIVERERQVRK